MAFDTTQSAYQDFRAIVAERSDPIVAWVGAGLSIPAGLPSWGQLRDVLVNELRAIAGNETEHQRKKELQAAAE